MRIEIQKLSPYQLDDFIKLLDIFKDVFQMKNFERPSAAHLTELLAKDDFFVFVAVSEGVVVGGLTAYSLTQYYSESSLLYIYDLAVKKQFQRKGVGKKLILGVKDYCSEMDFEEIFVQASDSNEPTIEFYRSTGAESTKVTHFFYPMN
jgi:aminoglycoside 3-N-acetyltransferase I